MERQRTLPLIIGFEQPARRLVGVAQMAVDHRILGFQFNRAFQHIQSPRGLALPQQHPPETVDDRAVIGAQLGRATDHLGRPNEIAALFRPGITQVILTVG